MADFAHGIYLIFAALRATSWGNSQADSPEHLLLARRGCRTPPRRNHGSTMEWPLITQVVRASEWRGRQHEESIKAVNWWRSKWQTFHCHKAQLRKLHTIPIFLVSFLKLQRLFLEQKFKAKLILHILKSRNSTPPSSSWWVPVSSSVESVEVAVYASNWHTDLRWPCHSGWSSERWPATLGKAKGPLPIISKWCSNETHETWKYGHGKIWFLECCGKRPSMIWEYIRLIV